MEQIKLSSYELAKKTSTVQKETDKDNKPRHASSSSSRASSGVSSGINSNNDGRNASSKISSSQSRSTYSQEGSCISSDIFSNKRNSTLDIKSIDSNSILEDEIIELPPGYAEDRFRVDRKLLEKLLSQTVVRKDVQQCQVQINQADNFFNEVEKATNCKITWPSRLKIGAKSKKDPHIKIIGPKEFLPMARERIINTLDSKSNRVTVKMDVAHTDHSHVIGKGGSNIKSVMKATECHIHFPDSNRNINVTEKSNQVSIAGQPSGVEEARKRIRELLPIVISFDLPTARGPMTQMDLNTPIIQNIIQTYNITVQLKHIKPYISTVTVRGSNQHQFALKDGVLHLLEYFAGAIANQIPVKTTLELQNPRQFLSKRTLQFLKHIQQNQRVQIQIPDVSYNDCSKSLIITGGCEGVINSRNQVQAFLPIVLMFDLKQNVTNDDVDKAIQKFDCHITVKAKPKQTTKSCVIKSIEQNISNVFNARQFLVDSSSEFSENIFKPNFNIQIQSPPSSPDSRKSPSIEDFKSKAPGAHRRRTNSSDNRSPSDHGSLIGTQVGMHHSNSQLSSHSNDCHSSSNSDIHSDEEKLRIRQVMVSESFHQPSIKPPPGLQRLPETCNNVMFSTCPDFQKYKNTMPQQPVRKQVQSGQVRVPTNQWRGYGFSDSLPAGVLKQQDMQKMSQGHRPTYQQTHDFMQSINQGPKLINQYLSQFRKTQTQKSTFSLTDLFNRLGLEKYAEIFREQEIDIETFLTMTDQDLRELGVTTFGPRRKMVMAISDLTNEAPENREKYLKNQYQVTQLTMNVGSEW